MNETKKRNAFFIITMVLMTIYLVWRALFTIPFQQGALNAVLGILLLTAEVLTVFTTFELFVQKMRKETGRLELPEIPPEEYPHVDIFIATHNEPVDLLYKTVNAITNLDYPDPAKVHVYFCDDGDRPAVARLAADFGVGYLGLSGNRHAKSGNLNHALSRTSSPLIATFDADMIPQHTFLMKTVPYFLLPQYIKDGDGRWRRRREEELDPDWKLGLVQTPQSFYNPDLFQFNLYAEQNIPNEQDFFSKEVNILRNTSNAVAYTGSNTVLSRRAIQDVGGFPIHTITEDFETSIRMQQAGYITYATDEVQAAGLTTTTIPSMLKQRVRWARGILQSLQNTRAIWSRKLPLLSRVTYLNSFLYWWSFFNRLIFILSPILFALFDLQIVNTGFWEIVIFWLPSYFFYSTSMRYLSSGVRSQRWSQVVDTIFMPYLILPVLLETLHIRETTFKVTNKSKGSQNRWQNLRYALPHIGLLLLSLAALVRFTYGKYGWAMFYSSIIIFWLVYNIVAICYALFFMLGRQSYRESERIRATEQLRVEVGPRSYEAITQDVSDHGLSFCTPAPIYLPGQETVRLTVETPRYRAQLQASILYVRQQGEQWRYSARVTPLSEEDKRQYFQIVYDRPHSLPRELNLWVTAYDDILRNLKKRMAPPDADKRRLPRVPLAAEVTFREGGGGRLHSFNYEFFSATGLPDGKAGDRMTMVTSSGLEVLLRRTGNQSHKGEELLAVDNLDRLVADNLVDRLLADLLAMGQPAHPQPAQKGALS